MAQAQVVTEKKIQKTPEREKCTKKTYDGIMSFKFNARAREFVPRTYNHMPASAYFYPGFNFLGRSNIGGGRSDWLFVGYQEPPAYLISNRPHVVAPPYRTKTVLTDDLKQKIIKQVEYQFSNMSLLANESFVKHMTRDPNGYVPISAIASVKKIKSLVSNNPMLAQALRSSSRLVVSDDGKKVRRKNPFTEKEKEELQSRIVVAGNLPEDHSHQNLEKIFGVVGSVKAIQICHPHESHSSCSKGDFSISNKLHALVEYETTDTAQKAVQKLNDKRKWRKGLRVRLLLRRSKKSVVKNRKSEFDGLLAEEEASSPQATGDSCQPNNRVTESRELTATSKRIQWDQKKDVVEGVQNREDEIKAMVSVQCSLPQVETSAK